MVDEKPKPDGEALKKRGNTYLERIIAAEKREDEWRKDAGAAERAYSAGAKIAGTDGKLYDFNILHSNVETIVPAIYNSTPIPDIRPRRVEATGAAPKPPQVQQGQQPDPQAMMQFQQAAQAYAQKEQADKDAKAYGTMLERAIAVQIDDNRLDCEIEASAQDAFMAGRGIVRLRFDGQYGQSEKITFEAVSWRDYREGPASRWEDVPWIAFRVPMARETYDRMVDSELVELQPVPATADERSDDEISIWEVWDRIEGKVAFVREDDGRIVKEEADPLGLPGFFPVPAPTQPICLTGRRTPVCPFKVYQVLADELDRITKRINKIMAGLKVRGLVAGDASSLAKLADADDNEIVVESNLEQIVQTGGLDKAIAWWPVEQAIKVLTALYDQREAVKASIYEITGISDIVRGASNAGETATAQQIKTQWGSLRIQKMQRLMERQVRDIFVMMAHLVSTRFSPQTLAGMTGIDITPGVQQLMSSPVEAMYRVNVESNSTVRADLTDQKREMQEFLAGSAQFFQTAGAIIQQSPQAAEPLAEIYAASTRMFRLGKQAEDALDRFVAMAKQVAENPPPNPEEQKIKGEMAMKDKELQMDMQRLQAEIAGKQQEAQIKAQSEQAKLQVDAQRAQIDLQTAQIGLQIKQIELQIKAAEADLGIRAKQAETEMKLDAQSQSNQLKLDGQRQANELKAKAGNGAAQ